MIKEFPKMVYRADGAKILSRVVADAAELESAAKDGWGDRAAAREAAAKAPQPARGAPVAKGEVNKELMQENLALVNQLAGLERDAGLKDEIIVAKDEVIAAQTERLAAFQTFLTKLRDEEKTPAKLKAAIGELLGD